MSRYEIARRDYERLRVLHDNRHAEDLGGGWVEGEKLFELLQNPTKKEAAIIYESLITRCATSGFEGAPVNQDIPEVMEIFERHNEAIW